MDKEEVLADKFETEKADHLDVEGQLELNEEDDSPIEEVRVTVPSELSMPSSSPSIHTFTKK